MSKKTKNITVEELLIELGFKQAYIDKNQAAIEAARPKLSGIIERLEVELKPDDMPEEKELRRALSELRDKVNCEDDDPLKVIMAASNGDWKRRTMIMMPSIGSVNATVFFAIAALMRQGRHIGFVNISDTVIQRSRNLCAHEFLKTEAEHSLWIDSDVVVPFGPMTPGFFYERLKISPTKVSQKPISVNIESRLRSHGKSIVGAIYRQRIDGGKLVTAAHIGGNKALADEIDEGPSDRIIKVDFVATGCAMVRRDVYTAIMEKHPERMGRDGVFDFFGHDCGNGGEDIAFCKLAAEAGHSSFLDLLPRCAHIGNMAFM